MKNNLKIYLCLLVGFLSFQEQKIESTFEILGPWGQGLEIKDLNWLDNENIVFLEESPSPPFGEKVKFLNINRNGIFSSLDPIGRILKVNNGNILWKQKTLAGPTVLWYGKSGKEKILAESQTDIKEDEISLTESGKLWIRGWVDDETYLIDNDFKISKNAYNNIYYLEEGKIKRTVENGEIETIYQNEEPFTKISNFAIDKKANILILENKDGLSRLSLAKSNSGIDVVVDWTKEYTIGIYGGENLGWRMNPKNMSSRKQQFCTFLNFVFIEKKCFTPTDSHFLQVYQWSLKENLWINSLIDVKANQINLIKWDVENNKFQIIAKMDKLKSLSISPDNKKIAVTSTTHKQHWNWDIFVLNLD